MNCKEGDIAQVIWPPEQPKPALVEVVERCRCDPGYDERHPDDPHWHCITLSTVLAANVNGDAAYAPPGSPLTCPDKCLRPWRPGDAEDEVLRVVGKPEVTA